MCTVEVGFEKAGDMHVDMIEILETGILGIDAAPKDKVMKMQLKRHEGAFKLLVYQKS